MTSVSMPLTYMVLCFSKFQIIIVQRYIFLCVTVTDPQEML